MQNRDEVLSKVPEVTLGFWIIKILATTLGETGGDLVTMTWLHADQNAHNGGYLIGTGIFLALFVAAVVLQISTRRFNAWIYWLAIVASTTVGTAMADLFDRSLGIGYTGGSSILLACVLCCSRPGISLSARSTFRRLQRLRSKPSTGRPLRFRRHWERR
jgi:uncharacterized membrane-anchored protein